MMLTVPQSPPAPASAKWYGPVAVTIDTDFGGNPYDPDQNDVRVRFRSADGKTEERLAFANGNGGWTAYFATKVPGNYRAEFWRNGAVVPMSASDVVVEADMGRGFLRRNGRFFRWDNGAGYFPIGFNVGWQNPSVAPMPEQFEKMGKAGLNWARIWACAWDGKNPWISNVEDDKPEPGELWPPALKRWDDLLDAADKNDIGYQMVLFHHGLFSSRVNPNWPEHPWNAKNGGFLKDAADFFTDAEAKRRSKMWLRYAVARYGHRPNLIAWELFNEVEWVDARYADRWPDIEKWHAEMATYVRELDPYDRLVTTSSEMEREALWESMDFYQPHTYPQNLRAKIGGTVFTSGKPGFYGEFGPPDNAAPEAPRQIRDGIFAGVFAGHAGAGQYWFWDEVDKRNWYGFLGRAADFLAASKRLEHPDAVPMPVRASTVERGPYTLSPGGGWEKSKTSAITLPGGDTPTAIAGLSSYFQSRTGNNRAMHVPFKLTWRAPQSGKVRIEIAGVSKGGARLNVDLNGDGGITREFGPQETDRGAVEPIVMDFAAGYNELVIDNDGADWVNIRAIRIDGLAPVAYADGLADGTWGMLRVVSDRPVPVDLVGVLLQDGTYAVECFNLEAPGRTTLELTVRNGAIAKWTAPYPETGAIFRRK